MAVKLFAADPSSAVEQAFRRIETARMAGLPFCNAALRVEAVGFALRDEQWLGVLVTPWAMNLMLLPATAATWVSAPEGRRLMIRYPAGEFAFLGGEEAEIGEYLSCPLFAAMAQFQDQETARLTARASLIALVRDPAQLPDGDAEAVSEKSAVAARLSVGGTGDGIGQEVASPSRRRLFTRAS
jgi:[NiFe] hydrogenase assembly HybE family chaperone